MINIDEYFSEISEKYYKQFVKVYEKRMEKAIDKNFAHLQFVEYCRGILEVKFKISERSRIIDDLEPAFKLGNSLQFAIKTLKKKYCSPKNNSGIVTYTIP